MVLIAYSLSSRHMRGPTTDAAPLASLKVKCPLGQALDRPHFCRSCFVAVSAKSREGDLLKNRRKHVSNICQKRRHRRMEI